MNNSTRLPTKKNCASPLSREKRLTKVDRVRSKDLTKIRKNQREAKSQLQAGILEQLSSMECFDSIQELIHTRGMDTDGIVGFGESLVLFLYDVYRCASLTDLIIAVTHLVKHCFPHNVTFYLKACLDFVKEHFQSVSELQDGLFGENVINSVHDIFTQDEKLRETKVFKTMSNFVGYVGCFLLDLIPATDDSSSAYRNIQQFVLSKKFEPGASAAYNLLKGFVYLLKQGYQAVKSGVVLSFFYTKTSLTDWFALCSKVKLEITNLNSPDAMLRLKQSDILRHLDDAIKRGVDMLPLFSEAAELKIIKGELQTLHLERNRIHNGMISSRTRAAPLAVLVYSLPNMGKSSFMKILHSFFASHRGLERGDDSRYIRNFHEDYWSNFKTTMWCIILDDMANENPNVVKSLKDSSVSEILQIMNNVSYLPNMAKLEEKGSVVCMPELVLATTNQLDLNAKYLYANPYAVQRRFPYTITLKVKEAFRRDDGGLDSEKITAGLLDCWDISVAKPTRNLGTSGAATVFRLEDTHNFSSISTFLKWYAIAIDAHFATEDKVVNFVKDMDEMTFCHTCFGDAAICGCVQLHAGLPGVAVFVDPAVVVATVEVWRMQLLRWFVFWKDMSEYYGWYSLYALVPILFPWFSLCPFLGLRGVGIIYGICVVFQTYHSRMFLQTWFLSFLFSTLAYLPHSWQVWFLTKMSERMMNRLYGASQSKIFAAIQCLSTVMAVYAGYKVTKVFFSKANSLESGKKIIDENPQTLQQGEVPDEEGLQGTSFPRRPIVSTCPYHSDCESTPSDYEDDSDDEETLQGALVSRSGVPISDVYYNDVERSISTDFGRRVCSWKTMPREDVINKLVDNIVTLRSSKKFGVGFFVGGNVLVTNHHLFPQVRTFTVSSTQCGTKEMTVADGDVVALPEQDLLFIRFRAMPPRRSLLSLFPRNHLLDLVCPVSIIGRSKEGELRLREGRSCSWTGRVELLSDGILMKTYQYETNIGNTIGGDCGSIYVAWTNAGPSLLGIHQNLSPFGFSRCVALTEGTILKAIEPFGPLVQGGSLLRTDMTFSLAPLSMNSNLRRISAEPPHVFGTSVARFPSKSRVRRTSLFQECLNRGFVDTYAAPAMRERAVWLNQMRPMLVRTDKMDLNLMDRATDMYIEEVVDALTDEDLSQVTVLSDFDAVNGIDGMLYVDKIPRKTSAGFPYNKPKTHFLALDQSDKAHVDALILDDAHEMETQYKELCRSMPIFMGSLKDEVISKTKAENKMTRLFTGSPFAFSIVMRKYLLKMNALIQSRRELFESYPGTDALGPDWEALYHHLTKFGVNRMCAGDYKQFDKSMSPMVILSAFRVLIEIAHRAGWPQEDINVIVSLQYDIAFPVVNLDGDIIMTEGGNPSGHSLTVIVNCIVNCIYVRMCFIQLHPDRLFKEWVSLATYGDDNVMGIREGCDLSHSTLATFLGTQGIVYTMADKSSVSIPYVPVSEVTFLKRSFVFDVTLGHVVGPLDKKSSQRSLMYGIPSLAVSDDAQLMDTLDTYLREAFFHGEDIHRVEREWVLAMVESHDLTCLRKSSHFVPYPDLKDWYLSKFPEIQGGCLSVEEVCVTCGHFDCDFPHKERVVCLRCFHCRPSRTIMEDRWFLGCLYCEMVLPLHCDFCLSSDVVAQIYEGDCITTHFYCSTCFEILKKRSDYIVRKQSNGPYWCEPVRYALDLIRLPDGGNEDSLDLRVPTNANAVHRNGISYEL